MEFNEIPYWLRGGILIFPIVAGLLVLFGFVFALSSGGTCPSLNPDAAASISVCFKASVGLVTMAISALPLSPLIDVLYNLFGNTLLFYLIFYLILVILLFLTGTLIGWVFGKIK